MKNNGLIKAVIFDLGRVLVNVDTQKLCGFFFEQYPAEDAPQVLGRIMADPVMIQYSIGQIDSRDFHHTLCERYGLKLSFDAFAHCWCDIFAPMEGMEPIVAQLEGRVKLGLLSDTDPLHWEYIRDHYPWMRYFQHPTLSFQIGSMKPSRESYLAAAGHVGLPPEACLFIDDLQKNVEGACAAGMSAVRFQGAAMLQNYLAGEHLL
ncbi:MAG: HAD family phosphatase [Anaerohalosphaeraceae bacterium]